METTENRDESPQAIESDELLKPLEVAEICRVSKQTAYDMINQLPHLRIRGSLRIWRSELMRHLENCEERPEH